VHAVSPVLAHRRPSRPAPSPAQTRRARREKGISLLMVMLLIGPLLVVAALVTDVGFAKQRRREIQSGADAAALAAAQELDGGSTQITRAISAAKTWAGKNVDGLTLDDWKRCSDPDALTARPDTGNQNTCISFDSTSAPTRVRVRIPDEDQPQIFGALARSGPLEVTAFAVAARAPGTPSSLGQCGLCTRDLMRLSGNLKVQIIGGGTIHAKEVTANWITSSATITPCPIKMVTSTNNPPNARCPGTNGNPISTVPAPPPDPFAGVPDPPTNIPPCRTPQNQPCNINNASDAANLIKPDRVFTQSVSLSNMTLNLAPGNYFFAEGFKLNGNVTLNGTGVTLFFVCASSNQPSKPCSQGGSKGFIEATNSGNKVNITAPTTGPYAGLAMYFDRGNTQGTAPKFAGSGSTYTFVGSIYGYGAKFTNEGTRTLDVTGRIYTLFWEDNGNGSNTIVRYDGGSSSSGGGGGAISLVG
jgi:Flp pilus assembly protein TadG